MACYTGIVTRNDVAELFDRLARGDRPASAELTLLNDLDREAAAAVAGRWLDVPLPLREDMVARLAELAEDNTDLDFAALLRAGLDDPDPTVRRAAIGGLWESRARGIAASIARRLRGDADESVRRAAATALRPQVLAIELGELRGPEAEEVVDALRDAAGATEPSVGVRAGALESLGALTREWVEALILDAHYGAEPEMAISALRAMGDSAQERWIEYLEEAALSDEAAIRYEAAIALGEIGSEACVEALAGLLADEDPEVIAVAATALGSIGGDDAVIHLRRFNEIADEAVREAVDEAIERAKALEDEDIFRSRIGL